MLRVHLAPHHLLHPLPRPDGLKQALTLTLYETLQILSLTLFEQTPLDQLLSRAVTDLDPTDAHNQMNLFE
jgi:hypothetical protein